MIYTDHFASPVGNILLAADGSALTHLCFEYQKHVPVFSEEETVRRPNAVIAEAVKWLDVYFGGGIPDFLPPLRPAGSVFRRQVWDILLTVPYGQTVSYGDVAAEICRRTGVPRMSAQAVGGAVGANPVAVIIPCHRVIGKTGDLVGFGGGTDTKRFLLDLEGAAYNG